MTPKERMARAMDPGVPDRVPVMCQMSIGHMLLQTGLRPSRFWLSGECFAQGLLDLRKLYGFDGILISLHGHLPNWESRIARIKTGEGGETVFWKNGDRTFFPSDDLPRHSPAKTPRQISMAEFNPESVPDSIDHIPVSQGLDFSLDPEHLFDVFDIIEPEAGADYSIHGEVTSPFDYFLSLFNYSDALVALLEQPQKSKAILGRLTESVVELALGMTEHHIDALKISSPYAGSGFISPRFYREFVLPYEGRIAREVRARGVHVYTHTCGAINDRLEMMVEAGASGIECLDPPPLGDVELGEAKRRIGDRVFIKGNLDPVNVLLGGTAEAVEAEARRLISIGKPGGGYILSTSCSIAPHTPPENVQVLAKAAEKDGAY